MRFYRALPPNDGLIGDLTVIQGLADHVEGSSTSTAGEMQ